MAYGGSNDDVIDDVTWLWKVKVVIPIYLKPVISKTARDNRDLVTIGAPIGNGMRGIEWSRDRWRHVTMKGEGRDPSIFKARYFVQNSLGGYMHSLSAF